MLQEVPRTPIEAATKLTFGSLLYAAHRMRRSLNIALGRGGDAAYAWGMASVVATEVSSRSETHVSDPSGH
mgnify:CR=1 FL=1